MAQVATGGTLPIRQSLVLDNPPVFAVAGLAVGDLLGDASPELVVASLNGDLLIYGINGGRIQTPPLQRVKLDGAVGAHNGLIIDDLDPSFFGNELYVAGSMGIRKFVRLEVSRPAPLIGK